MDLFNNRELASATLLAIMFLWGWVKGPDFRNSLYEVLKSLLQRQILITLLTLFIFVLIVVYFLAEFQIWNSTQTKNTTLWFLFIGVAQLFSATKIKDMNLYLKTSINSHLRLIVIIEFLVAFHSYGYFTEIILMSVVTLLMFCSVVSERKAKNKKSKRIFDAMVSCIGVFIFLDSMLSIYLEPSAFLNINTFRDFLIPVALSVCFLPYMYFFYYFMSYEKAFVKIRVYTDCRSLRRYAMIKSLISFRGNVKLIGDWISYSCIPEFKSKQTIRESIEKYKKKHCSLEL